MDFVDAPPEHKRRVLSQKWVDVVAELIAAGGTDEDWGMVGNYSPGTATGIRRGAYGAFLVGKPEGMDAQAWMDLHWEVTTRKTSDGRRNDIYIRYLP